MEIVKGLSDFGFVMFLVGIVMTPRLASLVLATRRNDRMVNSIPGQLTRNR
jgi:hypothetical protein